jgi:NADPH:quinone reductase-like Zn-dependent oxidoreductase
MQAATMVPGADGGIWDIRDVQRPIVTAGHVLARVYGSSLNPAEFQAFCNLRLQSGTAAPAERPGGGDAAGEVVEAGAGVTRLQARRPGDGAVRRRLRRICSDRHA